jgi:hypothetical protein
MSAVYHGRGGDGEALVWGEQVGGFPLGRGGRVLHTNGNDDVVRQVWGGGWGVGGVAVWLEFPVPGVLVGGGGLHMMSEGGGDTQVGRWGR